LLDARSDYFDAAGAAGAAAEAGAAGDAAGAGAGAAAGAGAGAGAGSGFLPQAARAAAATREASRRDFFIDSSMYVETFFALGEHGVDGLDHSRKRHEDRTLRPRRSTHDYRRDRCNP
jgi:hypothetical protein